MGAILYQKDTEGNKLIISCFSKRLDKAQINYSVTDKELLSVVKSIKHFRYYLIGDEFTLETDHKSLIFLKTFSNPSARMLRWSLKLQEYKFIPIYIKGERNAADLLSKKCNSINITEYSENNKKEILDTYHLNSGHGSANNMIYLFKEKYNWLECLAK